MCTAITYQTKNFYFGRTLDYSRSYGEEVVVLPRSYPLHFLEMGSLQTHYAIVGMASVQEGIPLYYDAVNEKGLCIAGLNFVGNAVYRKHIDGKSNVAQYELIAWLLSQCATVEEAKKLLAGLNILDTPFSPALPVAQLHWLIADRTQSITLESVTEGLMIYDNPVGVLANNPPFPLQLFHLNNYRHLSPRAADNTFAPALNLDEYSQGLGAMGLPGDLSSQSRFVRAAFTKLNSVCADGENESVSQFFHILNAVGQPRGCNDLGDEGYMMTIYTSCCNADKGIYYYTTYDNHQITAVDLRRENLNGSTLARYPLLQEAQIRLQNA